MPFTQEELQKIADKAIPFYLARYVPPPLPWWQSGYRLFLRTLRSAYSLIFAALITLHNPGGHEIFVNAEEIMIIRPAGPPLDTHGCRSAVMVHDREICVREEPRVVKQLRDGE